MTSGAVRFRDGRLFVNPCPDRGLSYAEYRAAYGKCLGVCELDGYGCLDAALGIVDFGAVPLLLVRIVLETVYENDFVAGNIAQGLVGILRVESLLARLVVNI